jgi:hypothetical protein
MPRELRALFERYNALGRLLPAEPDWGTVVGDAHARVEAKVVLREMAEVKKRIDLFLTAACARPPTHGT